MAIALPGPVQVAGISDKAEARLVIEAGANMLGFPLGLNDGREDLTVDEARAVIAGLPADVAAVCITYVDRADDILALCDRIGAHWVQLHGPVSVCQLQALRRTRPRLGIIKSLIVRPETEQYFLREIKELEHSVDAFISDTFDPETGRSGATGKTHDWSVSREIVEQSNRPVILAGGLTPDNVAAAIAAVRPAAVDVHSGVEGPDGRKDGALVRAFVNNSLEALATA